MGAIRTLGGMLSHYDLEQEFAAFGFGAKMSPDTKTKHCFPLNGRRSNPYCRGISVSTMIDAQPRSIVWPDIPLTHVILTLS